MGIGALALLLAQLLPAIASDAVQVASVIGAANTAVTNAQAGDGNVSATDMAAIQAATQTDLNQLAADAGITLPPA